MKRMTAILLAAILLISCFPLSALAATSETAETAAGIEAKFRLLLEDLELKSYQHADDYFYAELAQYPEKNPEWVLIRGGLFDNDMPAEGFDYNYATFGNKLIRANVHSAPFRLGWGVYDVKSGAFYDLIDAWNMNLNSLRDVWDDLTITDPYSKDENGSETNMYVIGDADTDGEVTIVDATRIQRCLADLDVNPWEDFAETGGFIRGAAIAGATDYDRDGDTTIMDATRIQRDLAELPNSLDYKLAWNERIENHSPEEYDEKLLITDQSQLDEEKPGHQKILDAYDDGFFKDHCLAALRVDLASGAYSLTLNGVSIDSDGVLNIDFSRSDPNFASADMNFRFIVIELSNTFIDSVKDIKVNIIPVRPEGPKELVAEIVPTGERKYFSEIQTTATDCAALDTQLVKWTDGSSNMIGDYGFDVCNLNENENGYMLLLKSREAFQKHFAAMDQNGIFDDAFFQNNAIIAVYGQGNDTGVQPRLTDIAVVNGTELYADAGIVYRDPCSIEGDTCPWVWYFRKVSQSDVRNVLSLRFWKRPSVDTEITPDEKRKMIRSDAAEEGISFIPQRALTSPDTYDLGVDTSYDILNPKDKYEGYYWGYSWGYFGMRRSSYGYVYLIKNKEDFEHYFPGFTLNRYAGREDEYFQDHAIVAMLGPLWEDGSDCNMSCIATDGNTLYVNPQITFTPNYIERETSVIYYYTEWASVMWTFAEVNQEDVKDVTQISTWRTMNQKTSFPAAVTENYIMSHTSLDAADGCSLSRETLAIRTNTIAELRDALDQLYTDEDGNLIEHDDLIQQSWIDSEEKYGSFTVFAVRVWRGSSDTRLDLLPKTFKEPNPFTPDSQGPLYLDIMRYVPEHPSGGDIYDIYILTYSTSPKYISEVNVNVYSHTVPKPVTPIE